MVAILQWIDPQFGLQQEISPDGVIHEEPTFVCNHCGQVWAMNPARERPRPKCLQCGSFICDDRPVCKQECVPQNEIFNDGFRGRLAKRAIAIIDGARTSEEVDRAVALME